MPGVKGKTGVPGRCGGGELVDIAGIVAGVVGAEGLGLDFTGAELRKLFGSPCPFAFGLGRRGVGDRSLIFCPRECLPSPSSSIESLGELARGCEGGTLGPCGLFGGLGGLSESGER